MRLFSLYYECTCTCRYYTSVPLTDALLLTKETTFTGTAMKNRKDLPSMIRDKQLSVPAGETRAFRDGRLLALAWRAESKNKPLIMLSSSGSAKSVAVTTRRGTRVSKPAVVNTYNYSMNGVDVADQLTVFYSFIRKTRKWWRKLFFYLMEVSTVNSYLLYKQTVIQPRNHLGYRRAVVEQMANLSTQEAPTRPGPGAPRRAATHDLPQRLNGKLHFIGRSPKDRDCVVCSERGTTQRRHRTVYYTVLHVPTIPSFVPTRASKDIIHYLTINNPAYKPISIIICKHSSTYTCMNIISICISIIAFYYTYSFFGMPWQ